MVQMKYKKIKEVYGVYIPTEGNKTLIEKKLFSTHNFPFPIQIEASGQERENETLYYISVRCAEDFKKFIGKLGELTEVKTI